MGQTLEEPLCPYCGSVPNGAKPRKNVPVLVRALRKGSHHSEVHGKYEDQFGQIYEDEWVLTKHNLYTCPKCRYAEIHDTPLKKG